MRIIKVLTALLLSLTLVSSSEPNPREVTAYNIPVQIGYHALPSSELRRLLRNAVLRNDPNEVRTLLENHVLPSQSPDETSQQIISHPCVGTNIPSKRNEFDINAIISDSGTLLHWAADCGYSDLITMLLVRGANTDSKSGQSATTPLIYAAAKGHNVVVAQLLNALASNPECICSLILMQDNDGWIALHYAALGGHGAVVALLLDAFATQPERMDSLITTQNNHGKTALHYAVIRCYVAIVAQLFNALSTHPERIYSLIAAPDNGGCTALHLAAKYCDYSMVVQLLDALATHPEHILSLIITKDNDGRTVLYYACKVHKTNTVKVLLERYKEALDKITLDTSSSTVGLLSTDDNFVNLMNQEVSSALHQSVTDNCVEIIDLLARFGANLDVRDENGDTLLHRAARDGRSAVVITLLRNDTKSQRNNAGKTPHDVAQGLTPKALSLLEC